MKNKHFLLAAAALVALAGCTKDPSEDGQAKDLEAPQIAIGDIYRSSISLSWEAVANAAQYGYTLWDETGETAVVGPEVTNDTQVLLTGLSDKTTYKFEIWSIPAANSKFKKSESAITTIATNEEPTPIEHFLGAYTYYTSGVQYAYNPTGEFAYEGGLTITQVEGTDNQIYLDNFYWSETPVVGTIDFKAKTVTVASQDWGEYGYVIAAHSGKDDAVVGTYDEEYNITFKDWDGYYYLEYDEEYPDYPAGWYAYFENTETTFTKGEYVPPVYEESPVDAICGNYAYKSTGYEYLTTKDDEGYYVATAFSCEDKIEISRYSTEANDMYVYISGFYDPWGGWLIAKADLDAKTLTIEPCLWGYYTFAAYDEADDYAADKAVVGTIADDGTITFTNWNAYYYFPAGTYDDGTAYDAYWSYYFYDTETVFTPYVGE